MGRKKSSTLKGDFVKKERFFKIMREAGDYTEEEIERIWKGAPAEIDEEQLKIKAKQYAKLELHEVRVKEEANRQLRKIQRERIEKDK